MFEKLKNDVEFVKEVMQSNTVSLFLLERGYPKEEVLKILSNYEYLKFLKLEVINTSIEERESFYSMNCKTRKDDILDY